MRKKKLYKNLVYQYPDWIYLQQNNPIPFSSWFEKKRNNLPYCLEIGMGTGDFLVQQAMQNLHQFFLGVEVKPDRILKAYKKASALKLNNIAFLRTDVESLNHYHLPPTEKIFILFPDPWPKKRHIRRRLTSTNFLDCYRSLLKPSGRLLLKTDNAALFEYSLLSLNQLLWRIISIQHGAITSEEEQTAYERRFRAHGDPIFSLEACLPSC